VEKLRSQSEPKKQAFIGPILHTSIKFTTLEIRNEIYKAKSSRSSGTDGIAAIFLKQVVCKEILIGLSFTLEKCAAVRRTPLQWKMSKIIPLFKKGNSQNSEN
jgi:hypothetical protein